MNTLIALLQRYQIGLAYSVVTTVALLVLWRKSRDISQKVLDWCEKQNDLVYDLRNLDSAKEPVNAMMRVRAVEVVPHPILDRMNILISLGQSPLAEGDLGLLMLRRHVVPGEHDAADQANQLVSVALSFTILGLIVTLGTLGWLLAPGSASPAANADAMNMLLDRISGPLSHLPFLFVPTGVGLSLAILSMRRQHFIENKLDFTWSELDDVTVTNLMPKVLKPKGPDIVKSFELISVSAKDFSKSSQSLLTTFDKVNVALDELGHMSYSEWAQELRQTAKEFRKQVGESGDALSVASQQISESLQSLPRVALEIKQAADAVSNVTLGLQRSGGELTDAAVATQGAVERLANAQEDLIKTQKGIETISAALGSLGVSLASFQGQFGSWSDNQQTQMSALKQIVGDLKDAINPVLADWRSTSEMVRTNAQFTEQILSKVRDEFSACNQQLREILQQQGDTFSKVAEEVSESLRAGHERFLAEVSDQFDQGEGLYGRLDGMSRSLEGNALALARLDQSLEPLASLFRNYEERIQSGQEMIDHLVGIIDTIEKSMQAQQRQMDERERALGRMMESMQAILGEQIARAVERSGDRFGESLKALEIAMREGSNSATNRKRIGSDPAIATILLLFGLAAFGTCSASVGIWRSLNRLEAHLAQPIASGAVRKPASGADAKNPSSTHNPIKTRMRSGG